MSDPIRYFEDLGPAARTRLIRRLERPGPDGLVGQENLLIRQHLRPGFRRLRPERLRQPARVLLAPLEPFLVDVEPPDGLPLVRRVLLGPLVRALAGVDVGVDWSQPLPASDDGTAFRTAVADHLAAGGDALAAGIAGEAGMPAAAVKAALRIVTRCLRHAALVADWQRDLPPFPILWIDEGLVELALARYAEAEQAEAGVGRLFLILFMRRTQDPALVKTALAAGRSPPAGMLDTVKADLPALVKHGASDELASLESALAANASGGVDYFRIARVLRAAEGSGDAEALGRRLTELIGRVANGALRTDVEALLAAEEPTPHAEEVERSLRELGALARQGLLTGVSADLGSLGEMITRQLGGGEVRPTRRRVLYGLHLLELVAGPDHADAVRRELWSRLS